MRKSISGLHITDKTSFGKRGLIILLFSMVITLLVPISIIQEAEAGGKSPYDLAS